MDSSGCLGAFERGSDVGVLTIQQEAHGNSDGLLFRQATKGLFNLFACFRVNQQGGTFGNPGLADICVQDMLASRLARSSPDNVTGRVNANSQYQRLGPGM